MFKVLEEHLKPGFQVLMHSRHLSCWCGIKATHGMLSLTVWPKINETCMQGNRFSSLCFFALWAVACVSYLVGSVNLWGDQCSSTLHFPLSTEPICQWKWCQSSTRPEKKDKMFHFRSRLLRCLHEYGQSSCTLKENEGINTKEGSFKAGAWVAIVCVCVFSLYPDMYLMEECTSACHCGIS